MSHRTRRRSSLVPDAPATGLSRRALLWRGYALGLGVIATRGNSVAAGNAALAVVVAAPQVVRNADCLATVSAMVTLTGLLPGVRYLLTGEIWGGDDGGDTADFCCSLDPQLLQITDQGVHRRLLNRQVAVGDLLRASGMGPARDEADSKGQVELFARVWLRDLTRSERGKTWESPVQDGPWDSPVQVIANRRQEGWTYSRIEHDNPLMLPRGDVANNHESVGQPMPREACHPASEAASATHDGQP